VVLQQQCDNATLIIFISTTTTTTTACKYSALTTEPPHRTSHLVPGSNINFVELVGAEMVNGEHQLLRLNVETYDSVVRQSRLKQLLYGTDTYLY